MPQTQYNLTPNPAQAGQLVDGERQSMVIKSVRAGVVIPFGVLCETYTSGGQILARPVNDATTGGSFAPTLVGLSMGVNFGVEQSYVTFPVPPSTSGSTLAGWPVGAYVPFIRRGNLWCQWDGNTGVALPTNGTIQVWHSSDGSTFQGVFTTKAAQTTLHSEIDNSPASINVFDSNQVSGTYTDSFGNTVSIVAIEINLPGHS
jgi:hypothetical protein